MDEHIREKEITEIQANDDERKKEEARMIDKLNEISQSIDLNHKTIIELDEHIREKEITEIQANDDANKKEEARMINKLNGTINYTNDISEVAFRKKR